MSKKKATRAGKPTKGIGRKLALYVPKEDEYIIDEIEKIKKEHTRQGFKTSLSHELIRLLKKVLPKRRK